MATLRHEIDALTAETVSSRANQILSMANGSANGLLYMFNNVKPTIQDGPQCGIVALYIAASCLEVPCSPTVEQIMQTAKSMGISHFGEILSGIAYWMAQLANRMLDCCAKVVDISDLNYREIVEHLLNNGPVLIPYDSDKNFEPCLKGGRNAHWCVLVGLFIVDLKPNDRKANLQWIKDAQIINARFAALNDDQMQVFIIAMHGKSRYPGIWDLHALKNSNNNLFDLGRTGLTATKDQEFKWPKGGLAELRGKVVTLKTS
ncbi:Peptidase C39 2 domain containing protein [Trichuris trichiura]|uniref:Actin maturation protease n=1 Tax=Trichuris trichiura TaxID=36087 RepID=A0A077YZP3_TRITR|nr:Peptidase C39 2 domain containing protein [Trichuris trichiura]